MPLALAIRLAKTCDEAVEDSTIPSPLFSVLCFILLTSKGKNNQNLQGSAEDSNQERYFLKCSSFPACHTQFWFPMEFMLRKFARRLEAKFRMALDMVLAMLCTKWKTMSAEAKQMETTHCSMQQHCWPTSSLVPGHATQALYEVHGQTIWWDTSKRYQ